MTKIEEVIKALELEIQYPQGWDCRNECPYYGKTECDCFTQVSKDALELLKEQEAKEQCLKTKCIICPHCDNCDVDENGLLKEQEPITGETSDGYHTFNELYHHRAVLFSVIVANYPERAWKAKKHHDGTMYEGMFIVGIETPDGQATYHYDINPYWDMFDCKVREFAPEWDGHTPAQAIERIGRLALLKERETRVLTLEEACIQDVCWLEWRRHRRKPVACRVIMKKDYAGQPLPYVYRFFEEPTGYGKNNYGKDWRCWTAKPTGKQREAVKWND